MTIADAITRWATRLGLGRLRAPSPLTGLVAAIVRIELDSVERVLTQVDEDEIVARLSRGLQAAAGGTFDGAERTSTHLQWYFFGADARVLEEVMVPELRAETRCRGALLRITSNGIAGPWREIRI